MRSLTLALAALVAACSAAPPPSSMNGGSDAGPAPSADAGPAPVPGFDAGPGTVGDPSLDDVVVYAHSADTLYSFNPRDRTVVSQGRFTMVDGSVAPEMLDLAVNSDGDVYTSSANALHRVDPTNARTSTVATLALGAEEDLVALTFVPAGILDPAAEVLIGATTAGALFRVDAASGQVVRIGQYPDGWASSGDLVSVVGLGTFATLVRDDYDSDVVAAIDFDASGRATVRMLGECGYYGLYGLGYWGRSLYGFTSLGELLEIDRETGAATLVTGSTGASEFYGAGVTTRVPVLI
ncbi:MAG: hypothetical protein AB7S26_25170 [Sandaracinaceae bacterium]